MCASLGPASLGLSELPGLPGSLTSFARLGKFSIFSNKFSVSCSSYSPSATPMIEMLKHLQLSWMFLNLSSLFLNSCFLILYGWISLFLLSASNHWFESWFPLRPLLVPCIFFFISVYIAFTFFSILGPYSNHFCVHPNYQCFELCIWQLGYLFIT